AYTDAGLRSRLTSADGTTRYHFDERARLDRVTDTYGDPFVFGYTPTSKLASIDRPNGVSDSLTYNASGDLLSRDASRSGATIAQAGYVPGLTTGLRLSATDLGGSQSYAYDDAGELVSSGASTFTYDEAGNRTS